MMLRIIVPMTNPKAPNANAVAIQHIKLETEGWERDNEVKEPAEPTFEEPR